MNIQEQRPGVWKLRWDLPRTGGRKRQQTQTVHGTRRQAERVWVREADRLATLGGQGPGPRHLTVADLVDRWLAEGANRWRPSTRDSYGQMARLYIVPALGPVRLSRLTSEDIAAAVRDWQARPSHQRPGGPVSPRMVRYALQLTRELCAAGVRWHWLPANPAAAVEPPPARQRAPTWWTIEEAARFLEATAGHPLVGSLYRVALLTGLRQGELLGLRWAAIDWDGPALWVRETRDQRGRTGPPKSERSQRRVPIDAGTAAALRTRRVRRDRDAERLGADYADHGLVWQTRLGTPVSPRYLVRRFRQDTEAAGLPIIRFHDLRHSHASALEAAGMDVRQLADRLGHAQIAFTLQTYTHARTEAQRAAIDQLAEAIAPSGYLLDTREVSADPPEA